MTFHDKYPDIASPDKLQPNFGRILFLNRNHGEWYNFEINVNYHFKWKKKKMKKHFNKSETSANKFQRKRQTDDRT